VLSLIAISDVVSPGGLDDKVRQARDRQVSGKFALPSFTVPVKTCKPFLYIFKYYSADSFWGSRVTKDCLRIKTHQRLLERDCGPKLRLNRI
jgi:hypothetical protein